MQSKFPLVRLAAKYSEMTQNGRILSLRASIEVIRTRIEELLERIDIHEAPDRLVRLQKLWTELRKAEELGQRAEAIVKRAEIDREFESAYHDYASWQQMFEALDLDRKLVESEVKIIKDIRATLTAEDAYNLTAKLIGAIISTINETDNLEVDTKSTLLKRISYEFSTIIGDGINTKDVERPGRGLEEIDNSGSGEMGGA